MTTATSKDSKSLMNYLKGILGDCIINGTQNPSGNFHLTVKKEKLSEIVESICKDTELKASLVTVLGADERNINENFKVYVVLFIKSHGVLITLEAHLGKENLSYPAISLRTPSASWNERELHDLYGIVPQGIDLQPLVLHRDWPRGKYFPFRKDFPLSRDIPISEVAHQFDKPHREGLYEIAVGPIHAGIIEPGHLRFCTLGEEIFKFDAQLFYTHKGIEKMAEGKSVQEALILAEHVCGMCAYSHSSAYCQAIETLGKIKIPERAVYTRTIFLEMERLSSHLSDLMAICSSGGLAFASAHAGRLREIIMRLNNDLTGHRFLRGLNTIGGLKKNISNQSFDLLLKELEKFRKLFHELQDLILNSDSLLDRLETTGYLSTKKAYDLGIVGPPARASNIARDVRVDTPYLAYAKYELKISIYNDCDALARTKVRIDEVYESIKLIDNLVYDLPSGEVIEITEQFKPNEIGIGFIESAKGELIHLIMLDEKQKISRWHVRSASYMNWRGMAESTMGEENFRNIVPDGPLVNKSFNLCYACVDR